MTMNTKKPAPPCRAATGSGIAKLASHCSPEDSRPLPEVQIHHLSARFGLDATRARLTAELAWRR